MKKLLVCGNMGDSPDPSHDTFGRRAFAFISRFLPARWIPNDGSALGGQVVKTRLIVESLRDMATDAEVRVINIQGFVKHPYRTIRELRVAFLWCETILILQGNRATQLVIPFLSLLNRDRRRSIRYIVTGGWLPQLLSSKPRLMEQCKALSGIYVETQEMKARLDQLGLTNVKHFPNFKSFSYVPKQRSSILPLRLLFLSRIREDKGVEIAIEAVSRLNAEAGAIVCSLDICGVLEADYRERFEAKIAESPDYIRYSGFIEESVLYETITQYDILVFPTWYEGEGFPGVIIDAYISGVPVLASDWKYNRELVRDGQTGFIVRARSLQALYEELKVIVGNPELLNDMQQKCVDSAKSYHSNRVMKSLLLDLGLDMPEKLLEID